MFNKIVFEVEKINNGFIVTKTNYNDGVPCPIFV